jgi:hypothetical protein
VLWLWLVELWLVVHCDLRKSCWRGGAGVLGSTRGKLEGACRQHTMQAAGAGLLV